MSNYKIPTYEQALEACGDQYAEAYYGTVKLQSKAVAESMSVRGIHIRNASSANLRRVTLHWIDNNNQYHSTDRITMARARYIIEHLKGEINLPADVLDNLAHNGYNGLKAAQQIKKNRPLDKNLLNKIQKTAISHQEVLETGLAAHQSRVALRRV